MPLRQNPGSGFLQISRDVVRIGIRSRLLVSAIDKNGLAPRPAAGFDVSPAISYHEASGKIDIKRHGGFEQYIRGCLPPCTILAVLITYEDGTDGHFGK